MEKVSNLILRFLINGLVCASNYKNLTYSDGESFICTYIYQGLGASSKIFFLLNLTSLFSFSFFFQIKHCILENGWTHTTVTVFAAAEHPSAGQNIQYLVFLFQKMISYQFEHLWCSIVSLQVSANTFICHHQNIK